MEKSNTSNKKWLKTDRQFCYNILSNMGKKKQTITAIRNGQKQVWLAQFSLYGERYKNISVAVWMGGKTCISSSTYLPQKRKLTPPLPSSIEAGMLVRATVDITTAA